MRSLIEAPGGIRFAMTDEFSGFRVYFPAEITKTVADSIGSVALGVAHSAGHRKMESHVVSAGETLHLILSPLNVRLPRAQARDEIYEAVSNCLLNDGAQ